MVHLSHTVLSLAPACLGDTVTTSVFMSNVSSVEQVFWCSHAGFFLRGTDEFIDRKSASREDTIGQNVLPM